MLLRQLYQSLVALQPLKGSASSAKAGVLSLAIPAAQPAEPRWQLWTTQETLALACLNFRFGRRPAVGGSSLMTREAAIEPMKG